METKSRYEVIAELEEKKRKLIMERDGMHDILKQKKQEIKSMKRDLEDMEEDLKDFEDTEADRKTTIEELISSVDESLKRLSNMSQSQKK